MHFGLKYFLQWLLKFSTCTCVQEFFLLVFFSESLLLTTTFILAICFPCEIVLLVTPRKVVYMCVCIETTISYFTKQLYSEPSHTWVTFLIPTLVCFFVCFDSDFCVSSESIWWQGRHFIFLVLHLLSQLLLLNVSKLLWGLLFLAIKENSKEAHKHVPLSYYTITKVQDLDHVILIIAEKIEDASFMLWLLGFQWPVNLRWIFTTLA